VLPGRFVQREDYGPLTASDELRGVVVVQNDYPVCRTTASLSEILYHPPSGIFIIQRLPVRSLMLNTILSRANDIERSPGPTVANDRWVS